MEEGGFSASIMIRSGNRRLVLVGPAACRGLTLPELLGPTTADDMAGPTGAVTEKTENQSYVVVKGKWERQKEKERKKWYFGFQRETEKRRLAFAFVSLLWRFRIVRPVEALIVSLSLYKCFKSFVGED